MAFGERAVPFDRFCGRLPEAPLSSITAPARVSNPVPAASSGNAAASDSLLFGRKGKMVVVVGWVT